MNRIYKHKLLKNFEYWNNTDAPEDITDWEDREEIFSKIFKNTPIPSQAGLVYKLSDYYALYDIVYKIYELQHNK